MKTGTVTYDLGAHRLVITIASGRRYFAGTFPQIAERFDGTEDPTEAIALFEQLAATPPAPAPVVRQPSLFDATEDSQPAHLNRVRSRIGAAVLAFVRDRLATGRAEFVITELFEYVTQVHGVAPASPDRILRDGRQRGDFDYVVVNRRQSRYRVTRVIEEPNAGEAVA